MATDGDNRGALFANDKKKTDRHPDLKGECMINDVEYWVSAWKSESKSGLKYLSMSFRPKDEPPKDDGPKSTQSKSDKTTEWDHGIPF